MDQINPDITTNLVYKNAYNIGKRIKTVRALTGLSRKGFEEKYQISAPTLRTWEDPQNETKGLTEKGAIRLLAAFKSAGIYCNLEWLLYGIGTGPKLYADIQQEIVNPIQEALNIPHPEYSSDLAAINDFYAFQANNPQAKTLIVEDDGMHPFYNSGDYVGGIPVTEEKIETLIGEHCIVETDENFTIVRRIEQGTLKGTYTLLCTNLNAQDTEIIIPNIKIKTAAKIIWIRKI